MKKAYILLLLSIATIPLWKILSPLLPTDKVDWFPFYDLEQSPAWYIYYSSNYIREILMGHAIVLLTKNHKPLNVLSLVLLTTAYLRLMIYWLFRGSIVLDVAIGSVMLYGLLQLSRWRK